MDDTSNQIIFGCVLALRVLAPLLIPTFPLPGLIAALLLDAGDQTVFQEWTTLDLDSYQHYDKALDVYYLGVAYLSSLRNWTNVPAVQVGQFLVYYRLVGVVLFEYVDARFLLVLFPNTFEYFFLFYEVVRLRWNPLRLGPGRLIGAAAAIWLVIKLPQEYWLHIAQRDVTEELGERLWLIPVILVATAVVVRLVWREVERRAPPPDYRFNMLAPAEAAGEHGLDELDASRESGWRRFINPPVLEKVLLLSLLIITFSQILPEAEASGLEIAIGVFALIVANSVVSEALRIRGIVRWDRAVAHFFGVLLVNLVITLVFELVLPLVGGSFFVNDALFFLVMIALMVTLYDRFHPLYDARRARTDERVALFSGRETGIASG